VRRDVLDVNMERNKMMRDELPYGPFGEYGGTGQGDKGTEKMKTANMDM
jgi:hypothetical protein